MGDTKDRVGAAGVIVAGGFVCLCGCPRDLDR